MTPKDRPFAKAQVSRYDNRKTSSYSTLLCILSPLLLPTWVLQTWMPSKKRRALRFVAERNARSSEANPIFFNCCLGEQLTIRLIPLLQNAPSLLRKFLTWFRPSEKRFRKIIFKYKNAVHANWVSRDQAQIIFNSTVTFDAFHPAQVQGLLSYDCKFTTKSLLYNLSSDLRISLGSIALS